MLTRLKQIHDIILRYTMGALWMGALLLAFFEFLYSVSTDDPQEANTFLIRCGTCVAVALVGAAVHAYLLGQAMKEDKHE